MLTRLLPTIRNITSKYSNKYSLISSRLQSSSTLCVPLSAENEQVETFNPPRYTDPIKAVILDWSGTTADAHVIAPAVVFYNVFAKHGVPITMEEARLPMGLRKDLHIAQILEIPEVRQRWTETKGSEPTSQDVDLLFEDFVPMQLECLPEYCDLLPGTVEAVNEIKSMNIKVGMSTGFTRDMVDVLLQYANQQGFYPDFTVAGDEVENNMGFRPTPFMIYKNLVNLGVYPISSVVKVDDTVSGVGEGWNAGCWSVGLSGYSNYTNVDTMEQWHNMSETERNERVEKSRQVLRDIRPHYLADDIRQLPSIIRDINYRLSNGESP